MAAPVVPRVADIESGLPSNSRKSPTPMSPLGAHSVAHAAPFLVSVKRISIDRSCRKFPNARWSGSSFGPERKSMTTARPRSHNCRRSELSFQRSPAPKRTRRPAHLCCGSRIDSHGQTEVHRAIDLTTDIGGFVRAHFHPCFRLAVPHCMQRAVGLRFPHQSRRTVERGPCATRYCHQWRACNRSTPYPWRSKHSSRRIWLCRPLLARPAAATERRNSARNRESPVVSPGQAEKRVHYQGNPNQRRLRRNTYILARRLALQTHANIPILISRAEVSTP